MNHSNQKLYREVLRVTKNADASAHRCFIKRLIHFAKFTGKTPVMVSVLIKSQAYSI